MRFEEFRSKYPEFIYKGFEYFIEAGQYIVTYKYNIPGLDNFQTVWKFPVNREVKDDLLERLFFELGMAEAISYWKCTCSKKLLVECGSFTEYQRKWWNKLFYKGLGEFMYQNAIQVGQEELVQIISTESKGEVLQDENVTTRGCLIPIGGGKDSIVSLELLKDEEVTVYKINMDKVTESIIAVLESDFKKCSVERKLDRKIIELNSQGFLNGHIPFSAVVAFSSFITAYLTGKKYIVLSNEASANETTVRDSFVNHQYSKSYEFEKDFVEYIKSVVDIDINYFSLLRPLSELQIAMLFSKHSKYHSLFRSCNAGSKQGIWCCNCPKCLFVYIILLPFLSSKEVENIFGENLLNKESNDKYFRELIGVDDNKPFECVGTREEVNLSLKEYITRGGVSVLTERYRDVIMQTGGSIKENIVGWNEEHNVPHEYVSIIKEQLGYEYH